MKNEKERDELSNEQLEQVVGGLKAIAVDWNRETGVGKPVGRPIPRKRRIRPFDGEPLDGGTVEVDVNA